MCNSLERTVRTGNPPRIPFRKGNTKIFIFGVVLLSFVNLAKKRKFLYNLDKWDKIVMYNRI